MSTINVDTIINNQNPREVRLDVANQRFIGNSSLRNKLSWLFGSIFNSGAIRCQKDGHTVGWISRSDFNSWIDRSYQENTFRGLKPQAIIQRIKNGNIQVVNSNEPSEEQQKINSGSASKETYYNLAIQPNQHPRLVIKYLKLAADRGHHVAEYELGKIYEEKSKASHNPDDYRYAQHYYQYAVNGGVKEAEVPLAEIIVDPLNPNYYDKYYRALAAKLLEKHAATNPQAAFKLGLMHKFRPMGQNNIRLDLAAHYLQAAKALGHPNAQEEIDKLNSPHLKL